MKFLEILIMILLIAICITSFSFGFYVSEDKGKGNKQQPQERQDIISIQFQSYPIYKAKCTKSNNNFCEEYSVFRVFTQN